MSHLVPFQFRRNEVVLLEVSFLSKYSKQIDLKRFCNGINEKILNNKE